MSLPVELLLLIASFQEPNDAASFTLTCKRATCAVGLTSWKKIGRGSRHTGLEMRKLRWTFLQTLEKDLPDYHLCHFGEIFLKVSHRNHSPRSSSYIPALDRCRRTDISKISESYSPWSKISIKLSFCDVQSILKVDSPTKEHSLDYLNISTEWLNGSSWKYGHSTYLAKQDEKALIHNNELYMYTCSRRWAIDSAEDLRDKKHLRPQFFYDMSVCRHQLLDNHEKAVKMLMCLSIPDDLEDDMEYTNMQPLVSIPFGCFRCPIECRYTIFNHGPRGGLELALEVVHILGSASSLHDLEWSSRGVPEWQQYSFDKNSMVPSAPMYQPPRFPFNRHGPRLPGWDRFLPEILREPGKALALFCPDGVPNAFDPEALASAREQRKAIRNRAGQRSAEVYHMQTQMAREGAKSTWQMMNKRWRERRDSKH